MKIALDTELNLLKEEHNDIDTLFLTHNTTIELVKNHAHFPHVDIGLHLKEKHNIN